MKRESRLKRIGNLMMSALAIILLMSASSCGNKKGGYKESFTAEDWVADAADEGYEVQSEADSGATAAEDSSATETEVGGSETTASTAADTARNSGKEGTAMATDTVTVPEKPRRRVAGNKIGNYAEIFNDSNHYQLEHARRMGIDPISDLRSYFHPKRPLVKVVTNDDFTVDELTHSYPYLVPEAEALLHDIGSKFREAVKKRGGGEYKIIVTSLLRTPVTVKKLRRVNKNATEQSTHQYATTFDIAYNKFDPAGGPDNTNYGDLKGILAEVLHELHQDGRCMVKYERKSPCFHITVVK